MLETDETDSRTKILSVGLSVRMIQLENGASYTKKVSWQKLLRFSFFLVVGRHYVT